MSSSPEFGRIVVDINTETTDLQAAIDRSQSAYDDRAWSYHVVHLPFTWQTFLNWWAARRWVKPRDVRKW